MKRRSEPTKIEKQAQERIIYIINNYCDGKQRRLAEITGVTPTSICSFVKGRNVPSQKTAEKICKPFMLNPVWLRGYDGVEKFQGFDSVLSWVKDRAANDDDDPGDPPPIPDFLEDLYALPDDQREKVMEFIKRFLTLPEEQQTAIMRIAMEVCGFLGGTWESSNNNNPNK